MAVLVFFQETQHCPYCLKLRGIAKCMMHNISVLRLLLFIFFELSCMSRRSTQLKPESTNVVCVTVGSFLTLIILLVLNNQRLFQRSLFSWLATIFCKRIRWLFIPW